MYNMSGQQLVMSNQNQDMIWHLSNHQEQVVIHTVNANFLLSAWCSRSVQAAYRVYANRTHDPITARKFNSRNSLYSNRTEATACNYFSMNPISAVVLHHIEAVVHAQTACRTLKPRLLLTFWKLRSRCLSHRTRC